MQNSSQDESINISALGINKSHGSSLCLVDESGKPVFCASEERFTRVKLQAGMPRLTYQYVSQKYRLNGAVTAIARLDTKRRIAREVEYYANGKKRGLFTIPYKDRAFEVAGIWYRKKIRREKDFHRMSIDTSDFMDRPVDLGLEHHLCHLASAYYCSGFEEAVVVSVDGVGDLLSAVVGYGKGSKLEMTDQYFQSEQISGQAYEVVTAMLGFHPDRHPGKVTGLAAYAEPAQEAVAALDEWFEEQYRQNAKENWFYLIHQIGKEQENLARLRQLRHTRFGKWSREEIAAAIQFILERDVIALIKKHVPDPSGKNIALAGGVFANVKLNQRVKALGFDKIFIQPAMGDDGTAFGAAILAVHRNHPFLPYRLNDVYLGPGFSDREIQNALDKAGLEYQKIDGADWALEQELAELLHQGHIIARFQGRMEFGPRALGNRSILYHTKDPSANDWLNKQLKRSEFMPFAPVTLYERAAECYQNLAGAYHPAEFMTITFDVTDKMASDSPACVHVDNTARPQLIREEVNPSYYHTLKFYHELSGIPSLINTSFNMHEEPIVCTPEEAIRAYQASNLDALAIGNFLVKNKNRKREA